MRGKTSILETRWLLHIDVLGEIPMKESIADINLPKTPTARNSQGKNQTNGGRLDNRTEGITIVNAKLLCETTGDQTSFVLINRAIRTVLGLEDPFAPNNIDTARPRHKNPSLVVMQSSELINHLLGNVAEIQKISYVTPRSIYGETSNE